MWGKFKTFALLLSLAVNLPFVALWAANTMQSNTLAAPPATAEFKPMINAPRWTGSRSPRTTRTETARSAYRDAGVTDEQWLEIEPRLTRFRESMWRFNRELKRGHDALIDLAAAGELDYEAIAAKQEEIIGIHRQMEELLVLNMLADREILTPEQQAIFFKKLRDYCGPSSISSRSSSNRYGSQTMFGPKFGPKQVSDLNSDSQKSNDE